MLLLLLLGYYLRLEKKARAKIERDLHAGDSEIVGAMERGAADNAEAAGAEPWPELMAGSRPETRDQSGVDSPLKRRSRSSFRQEGVQDSAQPPMRLSQPVRLPRASERARSRARRAATATREAMDGLGRQWAFTEPPGGVSPVDAHLTTATVPAMGSGSEFRACSVPTTGARATDGGESGQTSRSANRPLADAQRLPLEDSVDAGPPPTLPQPTPTLLCQRAMSQGKLAELVEAEPADKAARFRARRASIKAVEAELNVMFAGANGTKEAPGRCVLRTRLAPATGPSDQGASSSHHGNLASATSTAVRQISSFNPAMVFTSRDKAPTAMSSEAAHMAANIRSALGCDAGINNSSDSGNGSGQTNPTASDSRGPPDRTWDKVRAQRSTLRAAAACSPNLDRRRVLQEMHTERARLARERSAVWV